jgi:hypothetical protein
MNLINILICLSKLCYVYELTIIDICILTGDEVQRLCLQLAVHQSVNSPTAVMFLSSWMTAPLYNTLNVRSRINFFCSRKFFCKIYL